MKRKAVLCGINNYKTAPSLRGCLNDVENIKSLLINRFEFDVSDIHELKDNEVIKTNLEQQWKWLTENAVSEDVLVFHFSGHGSNVEDLDGDEEDARDEITCLYDMDFNNPNSYILDDEWYEWVRQVNPEANLIMIKDTCHSGGSSRLFTVQNEKGFSEIILVEKSEIEKVGTYHDVSIKDVPDGRFLIPPNLPTNQWGNNKHVNRNVSMASDGVTGVHLMACQEDQTAADAYIDGSFYGAFTYYLCEALRLNPHLASRDLIDQVTEMLRDRYFQTPNHEGNELLPPIFGSFNKEPIALSKPTSVTYHEEETTSQMLITAYMKLLDTVILLEGKEQIQARLRGVNRCLVAVHGIGSHRKNYSDAWWGALKPHVSTVYPNGVLGSDRREVVWSDLVNRSRNVNSAEAELLQSILDVIEDRREHEISSSSVRSLSEMPIMRGNEIAIDDFLIYMLNNSMRQDIIARFTNVVRPLLETGIEIDIISHSWGTVVAYEGLRELEKINNLSGKVNNFFTVGSALSIPPVQNSLREENKPTRNQKAPRPKMVKRWFNLDAKGDLVGGSLVRKFEVDREYLQLTPTSCSSKLWGYDLSCAHSSYFQVENLQVNRDIFALHINNV
jgi:metacaspase-1